MRRRFLFVLTLLAALAASLSLPWLAWREAQRQAYGAEADLVLSYARDVLHRADKTAAQVRGGIARLAAIPGPPCSAQAQEVMRDIDLTSAYIQAVGQLTLRVLDLVAEDAGPFLVQHPHFHIAINIAPSDLASDTLLDHLDAFLARTGAAPSNLLFEITERGFIDLERARAVIARLRSRGIPVAIDDFGTGYSSLSYLESLDLDFLKIDRSFIVAIGTQAATSHVVRHIIAMARTMGLRMVAEGVERPEQAQFLRDHHVHFTQGWLYGKPMPFADIVDRVARQGQIDPPGLAYKTRH